MKLWFLTTCLVLAAAAETVHLEIRDVAPLHETERERMRELVRDNPQAAEVALLTIAAAENAMRRDPRPTERIFYEGLVTNDPRRQKCVKEHLTDMDDAAALVRGWLLTERGDFAAKLKDHLLAWSATYEPTGNAVNENKFTPLMVAWVMMREDFTPADRERVDGWFEEIMSKELAAAARGNKRNNWHTKRLRMAALLGMAMERDDWLEYARRGIEEFVSESLNPDGTSYDFHHRDTLTYHASALKPLLDVAIALDATELYRWESAEGASLQKSVDFVVPYATGEKTRREWVNSKVELDRKRAEAGLTKYQRGKLYEPEEAAELMEKAAYFDEELMPLAVKLTNADGGLGTWQLLFNESAR